MRWSAATEIGDFVRDAARAQEFIIEIEGGTDVAVSVPSFQERTYFLRLRLKETTREIEKIQELKSVCDRVAKRAAKRVAVGGFFGLVSWWAGVYWLTFKTTYGVCPSLCVWLGWQVLMRWKYTVGCDGARDLFGWADYRHRLVFVLPI